MNSNMKLPTRVLITSYFNQHSSIANHRRRQGECFAARTLMAHD